jgi:hypothetical protein
MKSFYILIAFFFFAISTNAQVYHNLSAGPFRQDWTDTTLIRVADDWTSVPSIIGYLGNDGASTATILDPQIAVGDKFSDTADVIPNIKSPKLSNTGGVGEMEIENPVVAFQGSNAADAPNIIVFLNTQNCTSIRVKYRLRDVDSASTDNSIQPVALQYRLGTTGDFNNIPEAFVADASEGPSIGGKATDVSVILPVACENQALLQIRFITGNAAGNDEWIGVDDIEIEKDASTSVRNFMLDPSAIRVLSNPSQSSEVLLSFNKSLKGQVSVALFDQSGRILTTRLLSTVLVGQTEKISVENLPSGIYYLQVNSKEGYYTSKVIR